MGLWTRRSSQDVRPAGRWSVGAGPQGASASVIAPGWYLAGGAASGGFAVVALSRAPADVARAEAASRARPRPAVRARLFRLCAGGQRSTRRGASPGPSSSSSPPLFSSCELGEIAPRPEGGGASGEGGAGGLGLSLGRTGPGRVKRDGPGGRGPERGVRGGETRRDAKGVGAEGHSTAVLGPGAGAGAETHDRPPPDSFPPSPPRPPPTPRPSASAPVAPDLHSQLLNVRSGTRRRSRPPR